MYDRIAKVETAQEARRLWREMDELKSTKRSRGDVEAFHSYEDHLAWRILSLIAEGHPCSRELAQDATFRYDPDAERWYA